MTFIDVVRLPYSIESFLVIWSTTGIITKKGKILPAGPEMTEDFHQVGGVRALWVASETHLCGTIFFFFSRDVGRIGDID